MCFVTKINCFDQFLYFTLEVRGLQTVPADCEYGKTNLNFHPVNHMGYIYNGNRLLDTSDMYRVHTTPTKTRQVKNCITEPKKKP